MTRNKRFVRLFLAFLLGAGTGRAQTVDCLVAVVGGQPITLIDLGIARDFGLFDQSVDVAGGDPRLALLEALIDQKAVLGMGRELVTVPSDDVRSALEVLRAKLGPADFAARLGKFGLSEEGLRPYLEDRLRFERIMSARFPAAFPVSRADVEKFYTDVYIPEQKAKGAEAAPLEDVLADLEARLRETVRARRAAEWVRTIRSQAEVRINKDCLK